MCDEKERKKYRKKERKKEERKRKWKFSCLLFSAFIWASRTLVAFFAIE